MVYRVDELKHTEVQMERPFEAAKAYEYGKSTFQMN